MDDAINAARFLIARGDVDGDRVAIRGGSAGGYTTLSALTFRRFFKAGASHYGIGDLDRAIARDDGEAIIGSTTSASGPPPFLGDGRIAYAPVEDLMFGFALVLLSLSLWVFWGRKGINRTPTSGPPVWRKGEK